MRNTGSGKSLLKVLRHKKDYLNKNYQTSPNCSLASHSTKPKVTIAKMSLIEQILHITDENVYIQALTIH